uniref:SOWAHA-C winged helix-turn-helix domain-containing protein n=1 Tax=Lepisosteus oculatus TaxID=7918 RepID=W5MJ03_LEPOC
MGELSEDSLLDYLRAAGGRVKNSDLLKAYKEYIGHSDQRLRATYREQFKAIVDKIAVVKTAENGEKQLVLRKKFAPQGPRPAARVQWDGGEAAAGSSPQAQAGTRGAAAGSPKEQKKAVLVPWEMAPAITVAETPEPSRPEERCWSSTDPSLNLSLESENHKSGEEEPEPDAVSKSESERDDDGSGSVGSHGVALDPLEKEWMRSAACGQLAHLAQLLKQEPSLACKKDFTSFTALHWAAKHGREDMAAALAGAGADVNCRAHEGYTPLHIAALHGHRHIIDLLIQTYGAREDLRDYSGHKALQYLGTQEIHKEGRDLQYPVPQGSERRTKKLGSLFQPKTAGGSTKKKWGSVEDLAGSDEKGGPQLLIPPTFRPRKFSR